MYGNEQFLTLIRGYTFFNPHLTLTFDWFGETVHTKATNPSWQKWKPNKPTSAFWYEPRHLERLIAAYITHDRDSGTDRTVGAFVKEFDGLSGTKKCKLVLEETGLARVNLSALATEDGLKSDIIAKLLVSMKGHSKEVKPARLGIIGEKHFATRLQEMGGDPEHFDYSKIARIDDGIPFVLEAAFSYLGEDAPDERHIFAGANWSSAIKNPFRSFGQTGEGLEAQLTDLRAGAREPIVYMLHLAHPRVEYTDRGKSAIVIADTGDEEDQS